MRWDGQAIGADDGALPGLERAGLVRSVRTPEFAGITFHEVTARSALSKVPAMSRMPFRWTVNPYRGCSHACSYCLDPRTPVLLADGTQRPVGDLRVGDEIVGTAPHGAYRRYVRTRVLDRWTTRKRAYRVTLADGTRLVASGDHRFLTERGWRHVVGGAGHRAHLALGDVLVGPGAAALAGGDAVLDGRDVTGSDGLRVDSLEALDGPGEETELVDITTGTRDFVAAGVVSHNCFARPTHQYLDLDAGEDFDREVVVKVNVDEVLRAELARRSWAHEPVALGTNTDPYQRAEGRYRLMPGIIDALAGSGTPLSILTKGTLLRRDLPLLADASSRVEVGIGVSLALLDPALQASVEPGTPTPRARLDLIRAIREAGLPCGVMVAPVLPWLTDSTRALTDLLDAVKDAGATGVTVLPLHLKPGTREWYMGWLAREHPRLVPGYERVYARGTYASTAYRSWLWDRVRPLLEARGFAVSGHRGPAGVEGRYRRGELGGLGGGPRDAGPPADGAYPAGSIARGDRAAGHRGHDGALAGMPVDGGGLDVVGGGVEQVLF
ncbi:radical SAM protein [Cellulosimicrobium sp. BIT-GX5]|uniref:Radical SAM protein n=1 Tax=Cellulosimicrobium composti TaxID=2672572 RepID=A0A6N7ZM88_9MICO|nr:Rv2578c family radical SAM protein [Cellulosimicrobium composti]MTG90621.1 radical SAM protein [Cellulosimicrobium composti]SMF00983.1 intein N-terminal splicing region [Cellulosimicrobium cellulans J1]